ncbi:hypothetical protein BLOT_014212 [Blomia tropicalis]|nr:hypothetical protein BLOT_014212 [Blomia tropicalis]
MGLVSETKWERDGKIETRQQRNETKRLISVFFPSITTPPHLNRSLSANITIENFMIRIFYVYKRDYVKMMFDKIS